MENNKVMNTEGNGSKKSGKGWIWGIAGAVAVTAAAVVGKILKNKKSEPMEEAESEDIILDETDFEIDELED